MASNKAFKRIMGMIYGLGAAVVILGALFKIQHWPGASEMLTVGLLTEAVIFAFSAFEKPHEEPDWTLVYPELAGMESENPRDGGRGNAGGGLIGDSVSQSLDKLLEEAKIGPELLESLGSGLKNLSDSTNKLNDISEASVATNNYVDKLNTASSSVEKLAQNYANASSSLTGLATSTEAGASIGDSLQSVAKNLSQLNAVYELQLQGSRELTETQNRLYSGIQSVMQNLSDSVDDTRRYREEVAKLAENLDALNTVYGNMLSAMNVRK
ncbi:MAG: gliding motility protein GldL [Bacteroidia bacterium]|nr:gliding motility protein GldL [Bacteroidia bacterium]